MFSPFALTQTQTLKRSATAQRVGVAGSASPTQARGWSWLAPIFCIEAFGLLTLAVADNGSRANAPWGDSLFWIGLAILFVPVAIRLLSPEASRAERIGLVTLLGMALYVVKFLASPVMFTFSDEFQHVQTAQDILAHGSLFTFNSQLPISPLYPGLEIVTTTLSQLTGLTTFGAGIIVIGAARLLLMLALYLFFEAVSKSARLASVATLIYMTNPLFIFFDGQFAYESLAIGLGAFVLCLVIDRQRSGAERRAMFTFAICLALGALTITHHLTSYAIVALLLAWAVFSLLQRWQAPRGQARVATGFGPIDVALVGALMTIGWAFATKGLVISYVLPYATQTTQQLSNILAGVAQTRTLFEDYAGQTAPIWQRIIASAAVALIVVGLPLGLWRIWRSRRGNAAALALGAASLLYPISQVGRLTVDGASIAGRLPDYLFIGVGFTLAMAVCSPVVTTTAHDWAQGWANGLARVAQRSHRTQVSQVSQVSQGGLLGRAALMVMLLIVFIGGVVVGAGPNWDRISGPYLVEADMRSINSESIIAAQWALTNLGPGNAFAADRDNRLTLATNGDQFIVTGIGEHEDIAPLFTSPTFTAADLALLRRAHVRYVLVDLRLTTGLPHIGFYFEQSEPQAFAHTNPLTYASLTKFGALPGVNCVYDSGDILIYDMGAYLNA